MDGFFFEKVNGLRDPRRVVTNVALLHWPLQDVQIAQLSHSLTLLTLAMTDRLTIHSLHIDLLTHLPTHSTTNWLTDWLSHWFPAFFYYSLTHCCIHMLPHSLTHSLAYSSRYCCVLLLLSLADDEDGAIFRTWTELIFIYLLCCSHAFG